MDISLNLLRTFLLVAESRSFRGTSEVVHRSQSAVSAQIKLLEAQIGTELFHRTTRSVHLTAAGKQLFDLARHGLREMDAGIRDIQESLALQKGRVSVAATPIAASSLLLPVLGRFEKQYPGVRMTVREQQSAAVYDSVSQAQADFGIVPGAEGGEGADWDFEALLREEICALVPRRMLDGPSETLSLKALSALPLLLLSSATSLRALLDRAAVRVRVNIAPKHECAQAQTLIAMARMELGAAILPRLALPERIPKNLRTYAISSPPLQRTVGLLTVRGGKLSPTAQRLASMVRLYAAEVAGDGASAKP